MTKIPFESIMNVPSEVYPICFKMATFTAFDSFFSDNISIQFTLGVS